MRNAFRSFKTLQGFEQDSPGNRSAGAGWADHQEAVIQTADLVELEDLLHPSGALLFTFAADEVYSSRQEWHRKVFRDVSFVDESFAALFHVFIDFLDAIAFHVAG